MIPKLLPLSLVPTRSCKGNSAVGVGEDHRCVHGFCISLLRLPLGDVCGAVSVSVNRLLLGCPVAPLPLPFVAPWPQKWYWKADLSEGAHAQMMPKSPSVFPAIITLNVFHVLSMSGPSALTRYTVRTHPAITTLYVRLEPSSIRPLFNLQKAYREDRNHHNPLLSANLYPDKKPCRQQHRV
jgi:hypothetical protein